MSRGVALVLICSCLAALAVEFGWREFQFDHRERGLAAERTTASDEHSVAVAKQDAADQAQSAQQKSEYQSRLHDEGWISGSRAREKHEKEWALRIAHDPQLAKTILETNLLLMKQVGQDATIAEQTALEQVARLDSPPGSRVEVGQDGDGFRVRVAFMMSHVSHDEAGAITKYKTTESMRTAVERLSARVLRDLYKYCGSRGIHSVAVTCDHTVRASAIPVGTTAEERISLVSRPQPAPSRVYRMSLDESNARVVVDWQRVSLSRVAQLSTVEFDGLKTFVITGDETGPQDQRDPEGKLEF
jgi:hypothetical protein